uniref:tRNA 2-selenouridine synthase n=1 Tax=Schistocephalus solidus TaxID=70667 RepID=A0A0X3P1M9_SCHSO
MSTYLQRVAILCTCILSGCGKTLLLEELEAAGERVIHLERLANHKGSVFGQSDDVRPSQRVFERELHGALAKCIPSLIVDVGNQSQRGTNEAEPGLSPVWVECESRSVGPRCRLPNGFFSRLRSTAGLPTRRIWLDVPEEARVEWILTDYAAWLDDLPRLDRVIESLSAYHSRSLLEKWHSLIRRGDYCGLVTSLLHDHYDPLYKQSRGPVLHAYAQAGLLYRVHLPRISKDLIRSEILPLLRELTTTENPHHHCLNTLLDSCPI